MRERERETERFIKELAHPVKELAHAIKEAGKSQEL